MAVAAVICMSLGAASASTPPASAPIAVHSGHLGVALPNAQVAAQPAAAKARSSVSSQDSFLPGQLVNHGGPVMQTNTVHVMYWVPPGYVMDSTVQSDIEGFLGNVAGDSGGGGNVFADGSQYGVNYDATYGGSATDTTPYPTSENCTAAPVCLTEVQIFDELKSFAASEGWSVDSGSPSLHPTHLILVYLPTGVADCFDMSSTECSANSNEPDYCAYHTAWTDGTNTYVWGNMPATWSLGSGCGGDQYPNDQSGDTAVNDTSHEYMESLTDPYLTAWYDASGNEVADKCQDFYGDALGATGNGSFNQMIGSGDYWIQLEYSNALRSCFQVAKATIASVTNGAGATATIAGSNLYFSDDIAGTEGVSFNGHKSPTTFTEGLSSSPLTVTIPNVAGTSGHVTLTTVGGTVSSTQLFGGLVPTVSGLSNNHAVTGTQITVTGTGFFGVKSVKFNGVAGTFSSVATDGSTLNVVVPAAATNGNVVVTTAGGPSADTNVFTVMPHITSFTPTSAKGLTNVTIAGTGLNGVNVVDFTGGPSPSIVSASPLKVVAQVPDDATTGPITVGNGTDTSAPSPTSFKPLPFIASFTPSDGVTSTSVTITGGELGDATAVKFGTVVQSTVAIDSATQIRANVPAGFASGKLTVVTPEGTSISTQTFSITKVTSVSPASAPFGATITINGQGLGSTTSVDFQGHAGVAVSGTPTATSVKVVVPNNAAVGALMVNTPRANPTTGAFKPLPRITGFESNPNQVGDPVVVDGTNLSGAGTPTVKVGSVVIPALNVTSLTATSFSLLLPDNALTGTVGYTNSAGTTTSTVKLLVLPTISSGPTPDHGPAGTVVTLGGKTFTGTKSVTFNGAAGTFTVTNSGQTLTATVPATASGAGPLSVTNAGGSTSAGTFTVVPGIKSFSPVSGPVGGIITVTGTGFSEADLVTFGGGKTAVPTGTVTNTSLKVVVPPGATSGALTVHTPTGGTSALSPTALTVTFSVTGFTPAVGLNGTTVTLSGVGLTGVSSVKFNGISGAIQPVGTNTSLQVDVPSGSVAGAVTVTKGMTTIAAPSPFTLFTVGSLSATAGLPGALITIQGHGFNAVTAVSFNGTPAASFNADSDTQITAEVPSGATSGFISLTIPAGTLQTADSFTVESLSGVSINEVETDNTNGFIELYNGNSSAVDLSNVYLIFRPPGATNGTTDSTIIHFDPGTTLAGNGFLAVDDLTLDTAGGGIALLYPNLAIATKMGYGTAINAFVTGAAAPAPPPGESIARFPDGASSNDDGDDFKVTTTPTPGSANTITAPVTLTVSKGGTGSGTVTSDKGIPLIDCGTTCSSQLAPGTDVTLTATADGGSVFTQWSGGPCDASTNPVCEFVISGDTSMTAIFNS